MAAHIEAFKGLSYDDIGNSGIKLNTQIIEEKVNT